MYVHVNTYIYIVLYINFSLSLCIYIYQYIYIYIYLYICIVVYLYICVYVYVQCNIFIYSSTLCLTWILTCFHEHLLWPRDMAMSCLLQGSVQDQLNNVSDVVSSQRAFAAMKTDGSVVTWGDPKSGGDSSKVQHQLRRVQKAPGPISRVIQIYENLKNIIEYPCCACGPKQSKHILKFKSVGNLPGLEGDHWHFELETETIFWEVVSSYDAFAAILLDGSVVTWGDERSGGDSCQVHLRNFGFAWCGYGSTFSTPIIGWLMLKIYFTRCSPKSLLLTHNHVPHFTSKFYQNWGSIGIPPVFWMLLGPLGALGPTPRSRTGNRRLWRSLCCNSGWWCCGDLGGWRLWWRLCLDALGFGYPASLSDMSDTSRRKKRNVNIWMNPKSKGCFIVKLHNACRG